MRVPPLLQGGQLHLRPSPSRPSPSTAPRSRLPALRPATQVQRLLNATGGLYQRMVLPLPTRRRSSMSHGCGIRGVGPTSLASLWARTCSTSQTPVQTRARIIFSWSHNFCSMSQTARGGYNTLGSQSWATGMASRGPRTSPPGLKSHPLRRPSDLAVAVPLQRPSGLARSINAIGDLSGLS